MNPRRAPRDNSRWPSAESDRDRLNRCEAFQDVVSDGANSDGCPRDAIDRRWLA